MNSIDNFIPKVIKLEEIKDSKIQYNNNPKKDKNLYIQKLEAEIMKLKAEMELKSQSSEIVEALFKQNVTGVAILDSNYNYVRVNNVYAKGAYRNAADFKGHNHFELYPCEETKEIFDKVVRTKQSGIAEAKLFTFPDNPERGITYWDWTLTPVLDSEGEIDLLIWTSINVTDQIRKKEELYESEERYRAIFKNSKDGILLTVPDGKILSANPSACHMLGRSEEDLCAVGRDGMADMDDPRVMKALEERLATGCFRSEMTLVRKDGTKFPAEVTSKLFIDRNGHVLTSMIFRDKSESRKAEAILRMSEEKFSQVFYNNQAMIAIVNVSDRKFIDINNAALSVFGYSEKEIIGKSLLELNLWVDIEQRKEMLKKITQDGAVKDFPCQFRSKANKVVFMLCTANFINIGREKYILVSAFDITNQKKVEEALRTSEELFYKSFNANPLPMAIIAIETETLLEVNESFGKISGNNYEKKDLIGIREDVVDNWVDLSERDKFIEMIKQEGSVENLEVRFQKKSGEIATALLSGVTISWRNKRCILVVANDITELRRYQNEMTRMDRLKLIAVTSAGIAHEIRNPLTTVKGFLQLFKEKEKYAEDRKHIDLMIEELDRANEIITEFLSLAKNKAGNLKMQNLNASIIKMLPLLESEAVKNDIFIKQELEEIPDLMIDQGEIRQLILNLAQNGLDAMSGGGSLTIKTYMNSEAGVTLAIKDQGKGISAEIMDKIGMPFFTTKDYGLGLGLAICYNIAQRNNARIDVKTGQKGTTFKVHFPLFDQNITLS